MKTFQSWFFKFLWWITFVVLACVIIVIANREWIAKELLERQIRIITDLEPEMGDFTFGVLDPAVSFSNLRLYNPPQFGGTLFLDIPDLHVKYDRAALRRHELHIAFMRMDLRELDVVRNSAGVTNIASFINNLAPRAASGGGGRTFAPLNGYKFTGIDVLNISIGKVKFVDLKDQRRNRSAAIGLSNLIYTNVVTSSDLHDLSAKLWYRSAYMVGLPVHAPAGDTSARVLDATP